MRKEKNCVFLSTQRADAENHRSFIFLRPRYVIQTKKENDVATALKTIDNFVNKGFYAAGYLTYEAGLVFEERLAGNKKFDFPLLWFGIYEQPLIFNHKTSSFQGNKKYLKLSDNKTLRGRYRIENAGFSLNEKEYGKAVQRIKKYIEEGDAYQVNFTFKYKFDFSGSAQKLFLDLNSTQPVPYASFIKHDTVEILSFSPELFFRKKGARMLVKPMKGTVMRGVNLEDDTAKRIELLNSRKNRAENIMIVDLLRNDLGKISKTGTVKPFNVFEIEKHSTLFQMTSSIKATLENKTELSGILKNLFPSGSITGAPKIKTMQIIEELEKEPRGIYTGSAGFISPDKESVFNVAIRTIYIDKKKKKGEMGIGSGIVYDSEAMSEYAECRLKANFLTRGKEDFCLIETILWKNGFFLLPLHLERIESSAQYFSFKFDKNKIIACLKKESRCLKAGKVYKIRLLLDKKGELKVERSVLDCRQNKIAKAAISDKKTDSADVFLYHKTTRRKFYDEEYLDAKRRGFDEVIFTNEKGEVTEGAISNVVIKKKGIFYTPPISCGLLDGVFRRFLLGRRIGVKEKILYKRDLLDADVLYLANSVRGMRSAFLPQPKLLLKKVGL
ncbi:MAG: aminodeoxychorismate synthase component I [Candidatus Omnitrophota bacterium]